MKIKTRCKETKAIIKQGVEMFAEYFDCDLSDITIDCRTSEARSLPKGAGGVAYGKTITMRPLGDKIVTEDNFVNTVVHELIHIYQDKSGDFEGWDEVNDYRNKAIEIHAYDAADYIVAAAKVKRGEISQEMFDRCFCVKMLTAERAKEKSLKKRAA